MKTLFLIIIVSLTISGCSLISSYSDNLPNDIKQWITEKKYKYAISTIEYIKPKHKFYAKVQKQKQNILKLIVIYKKEGIEKSSTLADEGNWILAFKHLDTIIENVPNTKILKKHRANLLQKRNKLVTTYEYQLLTTLAQDLTRKYDVYEKLRKTLPQGENKRFQLEEYDRQRNDTSLRLAKRSEQQYKKGDIEAANKTIQIALKLNPDKNVVKQLNKVERLIKHKKKQRRLSHIETAKQLLKKLSQGYSHSILLETKERISWFENNQEAETEHKDLLMNLEKHLKKGVTQYIEAGRSLYSKGKIQEAYSIWKGLSPLAPEHKDLQAHILRASKVLKKLETLTKKNK